MQLMLKYKHNQHIFLPETQWAVPPSHRSTPYNTFGFIDSVTCVTVLTNMWEKAETMSAEDKLCSCVFRWRKANDFSYPVKHQLNIRSNRYLSTPPGPLQAPDWPSHPEVQMPSPHCHCCGWDGERDQWWDFLFNITTYINTYNMQLTQTQLDWFIWFAQNRNIWINPNPKRLRCNRMLRLFWQ